MTIPRSPYALPSVLCLAILLVLPAAASAGEAAAPGASADALYARALEHEAAGRPAQAREAYAQVVALAPDHRAARRALGYESVDGFWVRGDDLLRAKGFVRHAGRWMTAAEFADATRPEREAGAQRRGEQRVLALLATVARGEADDVAAAARRLAVLPSAHRLPPLARALRCEPAALRVFAAEALGRLGDPLAVPVLLKRTIDDPDESVRIAAVDALRAIGADGTIHPLGRALWSRRADVRVRAAEALGRLGDVDAAPYIVARWEKRSGNFPRAYLATVRQVSFLQDFDVEVAATSFIADPIVGVLQEGVVHDVRVLATEQTFTAIERVAYEEALGKLQLPSE